MSETDEAAREAPSASTAAAAAAARGFGFLGDLAGIEPYGSGHINETFAATMDQAGRPVRYLLQKINERVFRDPEGLMDNFVRVTGHLRGRLAAEGRKDLSRRVLRALPAREAPGGAHWLRDGDGGFWRALLFIEGASSMELADSPRRAFALGEAVGGFQGMLSDLPGPRLAETIPSFHDARKRYAKLKAALAEDGAGRASSARPEIDFFLERGAGLRRVIDSMESGATPERVVHNDTKMNNLLLDDATGEALCVIDLDTVGPGSPAYDFGDLARSVPATAAEDDPEPERMRLAMPMFEALARGYASGASYLDPAERELLPWGATIMTGIMGMRFLTDYLEGDVYYRTSRPGHNLDRCRTQVALMRSMDASWSEMIDAVGAAFEEADTKAGRRA
jgi:hypothetical protein